MKSFCVLLCLLCFKKNIRNPFEFLIEKQMKKQMLFISILLFPFIGMILINEFVRLNTAEEGYHRQGVIAINTVKKQKDKCSWICHDHTNYCKAQHVKIAKPYFDKIDPIYFGTINALKSTGDYGLANILFWVILLPLIMYVLLAQSIRIEFEIRKLKKR